jgi:hypothetical protein
MPTGTFPRRIVMLKNFWLPAAAIVCVVWGLGACATRHEVEVKPVEIKPIHITIDVNVRVEQALDDFFEDIDEKAASIRQEE